MRRPRNLSREDVLAWIRQQCDETPGGCLLWRRATSDGYPRFGVDGKRGVLVTRYVLGLGPDDPREALHSCDTSICVAREHLRPGTHAENQREMAERGRARAGHGNDRAVINMEKRHCVRGHPFDEANTYVETRPDGRTRRQCRACRALLARQRRSAA